MSDPYRTPQEIAKDMKTTTDWSEMFLSIFGFTVIVSLGVALVATVTFPVYKAITTDGRADYCYVEPHTILVPSDQNPKYSCGEGVEGYSLKQHIPWRSDRYLVRGLRTTEEIRTEAAKFGCEVR